MPSLLRKRDERTAAAGFCVRDSLQVLSAALPGMRAWSARQSKDRTNEPMSELRLSSSFHSAPTGVRSGSRDQLTTEGPGMPLPDLRKNATKPPNEATDTLRCVTNRPRRPFQSRGSSAERRLRSNLSSVPALRNFRRNLLRHHPIGDEARLIPSQIVPTSAGCTFRLCRARTATVAMLRRTIDRSLSPIFRTGRQEQWDCYVQSIDLCTQAGLR